MNGRPQESGGKSRDQKLGVFVDCNELVINEPITGCTLIMIESKNLSMNYKILWGEATNESIGSHSEWDAMFCDFIGQLHSNVWSI